MSDVELLRIAMCTALAAGLGACSGDEGKSKSDDGVHVALDEIKTGRDGRKADDREDESQGGGGSAATTAGRSTGAPEPDVNPIEICGAANTTVTKKDADDRRYGPGDKLGCATDTEPVDVGGMAAFRLDTTLTQHLRDAGDDEHCCYQIDRPPRGRPLVTGDREILAGFRLDPRAGGASLDPSRRRAAAAWLHDARLEAASVASFLRAREELRTLGAPAHLLGAYEAAADDEQRHTRMCRRWAEHFAGRQISVSTPAVPPPRPGGLSALLRRTFDEGCVAETAAALVALRSAQLAAPSIARTLRMIGDDETRHAVLAWQTIGWGIRELSGAERASFVRWAVRRAPAPSCPGPDPDARHGRLSPATERAIVGEAWQSCIAPTLRELAGTLPPFAIGLAYPRIHA